MPNSSRREFLGNLAAASAFTIVPRRVLGGTGYTAPSDMILLAQVGCGDKGKILCDFRASKPRPIPQRRQKAFEGSIVAKDFDTTSAEDEWVNALKNGTKTSKGSFEEVAALAEAVTLAVIALRVPDKRLLWDRARLKFTNSSEATNLVRRQDTRKGWEQIIG
jgi:hypothetical protein